LYFLFIGVKDGPESLVDFRLEASFEFYCYFSSDKFAWGKMVIECNYRRLILLAEFELLIPLLEET